MIFAKDTGCCFWKVQIEPSRVIFLQPSTLQFLLLLFLSLSHAECTHNLGKIKVSKSNKKIVIWALTND
jgi:hypothetical protein